MAKVYTEEELNDFSRETLMAVILSMQDQIHQLNTNMERLIEQIADANNAHSGVRYSKEDIKRRKVERKFDKRSIKKNWRLQTPAKHLGSGTNVVNIASTYEHSGVRYSKWGMKVL